MPIAKIETLTKLVTMFVAVATLAWGVNQYFENNKQQAESRRIEATRPFLERQLKLYTEATQVAATIATSENTSERAAAIKRFWSLYWGELALVEDKRVEAAMYNLGRALDQQLAKDDLEQLLLKLAHACRDSLAISWGVKEWQNPYRQRTSEPQN